MDIARAIFPYAAAFLVGAVPSGLAAALWVRSTLEPYKADGCMGQFLYPFAIGFGVPGAALAGGFSGVSLVLLYQLFGWVGPLLACGVVGGVVVVRTRPWNFLPEYFQGRRVERVANLTEQRARAYLEAAQRGDLAAVRYFLDGRVYVDTCFIGDETHAHTALMYAAASGNVELVRLLLERGADRTLMNEYGRTPLELAEQSGRSEAADLLRHAASGARTAASPVE